MDPNDRYQATLMARAQGQIEIIDTFLSPRLLELVADYFQNDDTILT